MLVVLASSFDHTSAALVDAWAAEEARLMTPADLSRSGWRDVSGGHASPAAKTGRAVIDGHVVSTEDIRGVLVRLPVVRPEELARVVPEDREYVASEMMAFLVSWLSRLTCPVLNRATATCLTGPAWRASQWTHAASGLGIPVQPRRATSAGAREPEALGREPPSGAQRAVVVGDRVVGDLPPALADAAKALARAAYVDLLRVDFVGPVFAGASTWPLLDSPDVRDAVVDYFARSLRR